MKKFIVVIIFSILSFAILVVSTLSITENAKSDKIPEFYSYDDFSLLGIDKNKVEPWEDGIRTSGEEGTLEWWYTDAEFENGITVVVVFYTKDGFDVEGKAHPKATLEVTYPDGRKIHKEIYGEKGKVIDASKEKCDVNINGSYLRYEENKYVLYFEEGKVKYSAVMESEIPMWRPGTGHTFYEDDRERYFAWVVAQPSSSITGKLEVDGEITELTGEGYHDHNWGNIEMNDIIDNWYWGRAEVGEYNIITSDLVTSEKYGNYRLPTIMIAKDGKIMDFDIENTFVQRDDTEEHDITGKFMDNRLIFKQIADDGKKYTVEYERDEDIVVASLLDKLPLWKRYLAKLVGANPTYIRVKGSVTLTVEEEGVVQKYTSEGLWEQMSFGKKKVATINEYKR